jgi:hypothetical protein
MKNQLKYLQNLFYDLLNDFGRVYVVVKYSDKTTIGNRGFTEEEKKNGLVLIFNLQNHKTLQWNEDGSIITALGFGASNRHEKCYLHADDIVSVFSPDARVKCDRWDIRDIHDDAGQSEAIKKSEEEKTEEEKIVSLDGFRKTKK